MCRIGASIAICMQTYNEQRAKNTSKELRKHVGKTCKQMVSIRQHDQVRLNIMMDHGVEVDIDLTQVSRLPKLPHSQASCSGQQECEHYL